jgi:predicted Fe-Mo cluster-binding NifX family protein
MKAVLPVKMGRIEKYFERAKTFLVLEIEDQTVKNGGFFSVDPRQSTCEQLIGPMQSAGVELVIANKITARASRSLEEKGFRVITGACGPVMDVVRRIVREHMFTQESSFGRFPEKRRRISPLNNEEKRA